MTSAKVTEDDNSIILKYSSDKVSLRFRAEKQVPSSGENYYRLFSYSTDDVLDLSNLVGGERLIVNDGEYPNMVIDISKEDYKKLRKELEEKADIQL